MSAFDGMDQAALQATLSSLQQAYIELVSGNKVATASYTQGDGARTTSFTRADLATLQASIRQIQIKLGLQSRRRPFRPVYC